MNAYVSGLADIAIARHVIGCHNRRNEGLPRRWAASRFLSAEEDKRGSPDRRYSEDGNLSTPQDETTGCTERNEGWKIVASKSARPYRGVAHELEHLVDAITLLEERNGMVQAVATHLRGELTRLLLQCYICPSYVFTQENASRGSSRG